MGRKSDIREEIGRLRGKISEYQRNIEDLKSSREKIRVEAEKISNIKNQEQIYDVSFSGAWRGNNNNLMRKLQMDMVQTTIERLNEVDILHNDICRAINKYRQMIDECNSRISYLEGLLASLD